MRERSSQQNIVDLESLRNEGGSSKGQEDIKGPTAYLSV